MIYFYLARDVLNEPVYGSVAAESIFEAGEILEWDYPWLNVIALSEDLYDLPKVVISD